jgi:hypothetical protein
MTTLVNKPVLHGRDHLPGHPDPIPGLETLFGLGVVVYSNYVQSFSSLIGYWRLGETGEPWADSSIYDNDMYLVDHGAALTPDVTGGLTAEQDDGAVQLNYSGTGGETSADYLRTGPPAPDNHLYQLASFTAAAFVKVHAYPASRGHVFGSMAGLTGPDRFDGWAFHILPSGKIAFTFGTTTERFAASPAAVVLDTWYHVAGSYDGANIKLYLNGNLVATTAWVSGGGLAGQTDGIFVGWQTSGAGPTHLWFTGSVDEIAVWNAVLTADEIAALNSATSADDGTEGYVLTSDGTGGLAWAAPTIEVEF